MLGIFRRLAPLCKRTLRRQVQKAGLINYTNRLPKTFDFTPDQLERFPDGWFDLTQTISTLPEMPERQAEHFLGLLAAKSSGEVFLKQWQRWRNGPDGVEFSEDRYVLPAPWRLVARRVDPVQPLFFNHRWRATPDRSAACSIVSS